jgi:hypothetical protein
MFNLMEKGVAISEKALNCNPSLSFLSGNCNHGIILNKFINEMNNTS